MSHSVTPGTAAHQASLSFTISQSLLKHMAIVPEKNRPDENELEHREMEMRR